MTTHEGSASDPVMPPAPAETRVRLLEHARRGMYVMDAAGTVIGRVKEVHFGDPEAASELGEEAPSTMTSFLGNVGEDLRHPFTFATSGELRHRQLHEGYLRLDRKGIMHKDLLVESDQIADVDEEAVTLKVGVHQLAEI